MELPARHQTLIPMRTRDRTSQGGMFECCKTPGGVLLTKTVVQPSKDGSFFVKAVNLNYQNVTLFKNQKIGTLSSIEQIFDTADESQTRNDKNPTISAIHSKDSDLLKEIGVDLSQSESDLRLHEREKLEKLLMEYSDVFSRNKQDLGTCTLGTKHHIHLKPGTVPVKQPSRRIPFAYQDEVKNDLKNMLNDGIIEKSSSEWASPLVLVRKSSGDLRICVDYRKLNEATVLTSYPLPNLTETLDRLAGATFFTSIDMVSGYHQIEVAEEDKAKTAFISPYGLYQYCRMPYGLAGAPATFQSVVEDMVQVLDIDDILAYLDDVICFHATFDKHLDGVRKLLEMLRRAGFKLSAKKCQFAKRSVKFLGHIIDHMGVRPVPEKLELIRNWKIPESEDELRQVLGVCTFWRRFVKDFARIAVPLHNLLNKQEFVWTNECQIAFEVLKEQLCSSVTLKLPQRVGQFSVTCDASDYAMGYFLEQIDQFGEKRPVAFGGRKLHKAELNYSTTEKECLAVIEALKAYRPYLLGNRFDLYTDHQSLKWLLTQTKEHSGRLWRWVDKIREFQYSVKHIPGCSNTVADALSRIRKMTTEELAPWTLEYIRQQQEDCATLRQLKSVLQSKSRKIRETNMEVKAFDDKLPYLSVHENGVLCHCDRNGNTQVVIPRNLVSRVLRMMHNDLVGHLGFRKTLQRTKEKYYWPQMPSEIEDWCKKCEECQRRRNPVPSQRAPLQSITTCQPGELVTMDIVEYAQSSRGYRYCLVMVDHFTKWLELFPLRNQKAESIAKKVFDGWIP